MEYHQVWRFRRWSVLAILLCVVQSGAHAEPIAVRHVEGTLHGFLVLRSAEGRSIAVGELFQTAHGDRVTSRLVFHFKDGSFDEDTAVFSQRGSFRLITDHHVQRGPSYSHALDMTIDTASSQVTTRGKGKDGKQEIETEHFDLPPDLINGLVIVATRNILPETPETKVSMIVPTPKPQLMKVAISPEGEDSFSIAGSRRKATRFRLKFELGGIAAAVAPLIGKEPPLVHLWIMGGEAPAFVKEEGPLYANGPVWTIQLTSPVWTSSHQK